jgi:excisionase family DNA binding protein
MSELLSIPDAAKALGLNPSRVRALVASGEIEAARVGGRWLIERNNVLQRQRHGQVADGRPLEPRNAWGLIFLASGDDAPWLAQLARWRLNKSLAHEGLEKLAPRLRKRATASRFHAVRGEIPHLVGDDRLVRSGISAAGAHDLPLVSSEEVDAYVKEEHLARLKRKYALRLAPAGESNVVLRAVPSGSWFFDAGGAVAPLAAVALDLANDPDSRSQRIGKQVLRRLSRAASRPDKS